MTKKQVEKRVISILAEVLSREKGSITAQSLLVEDLECDSFNTIEILYALETAFKIEIPQTGLAKLSRVSDIVDYVCKAVGGK